MGDMTSMLSRVPGPWPSRVLGTQLRHAIFDNIYLNNITFNDIYLSNNI